MVTPTRHGADIRNRMGSRSGQKGVDPANIQFLCDIIVPELEQIHIGIDQLRADLTSEMQAVNARLDKISAHLDKIATHLGIED